MNRFIRFTAAGAIVVFLSILRADAQGSCGCGASAMSMGLLQLAPRHAAGLRGQSQSFRAEGHHDGLGATDLFRTAEVWGRLRLGRRWQLLAAAPIVFSQSKIDDGTRTTASGLGDASAMGQFLAFDGQRRASCLWQKRLQLGLGAKFPTGRTSLKNADGSALADNLQPGTGAADALATAFFAVWRRKTGFQIDATARASAENAAGFRAGARAMASAQLFSSVALGKKTRLIARAGAAFDARKKDQKNGIADRHSGGWGLFSAVGADVLAGAQAVGLSWQAPLAHDFGGGHVAPRGFFQASATRFFGGKKASSATASGLFQAETDSKK